MSKEKCGFNWVEFRKTGFIAVLLAVPIAIWRETKIGRRIAWITTAIFIFWVAGKTVDFAFEKIIDRQEIRKNANKTIDFIQKAQNEILRVNGLILNPERLIEERISEILDAKIEQHNSKLETAEQSLGEIERKISAIREIERESIKDRIIELRERVILLKESADRKENRKEFEEIFKNVSLLTENERDRFLKDLKDMGFYLDKQKENVSRIRHGNIGFASMDSNFVSYGVSGASVYVEDDSNN